MTSTVSVATLIILLGTVTSAAAQQSAAPPSTTTTTSSPTSSAPGNPGGSFDEAQIKSKLAHEGYTNITLTRQPVATPGKETSGSGSSSDRTASETKWVGSGDKDGKHVDFTVDSLGHIETQR